MMNFVSEVRRQGNTLWHQLLNKRETRDCSDEQCQNITTRAKQLSKKTGERNGLIIRKLNMKVEHKDEKYGVQKMILGARTNHLSKVILLVGSTGAGKTTLINAIVNFIYGVKFLDKFRLELIDDINAPKKSQAESQTDLITAYELPYLPGMAYNNNYILIDTPGFGDTRGIQRDREMMLQLENFLKQDYGVDQVDIVGFVTPSSASRLTHTQRYVFDGLSSMFGKDIYKNIYIMATFADGQKPPVLEALQEANINYLKYFRFNNSALYASNDVTQSDTDDSDEDNEDKNVSQIFWDMGYKSLNTFFQKIHETNPVSLTLTKEVLEERRSLHLVVESLEKQTEEGLNKLENLKQERNMLERFDDEIKGCSNYEMDIKVHKINKFPVKPKQYVTNCTICNYTCHANCIFSNDDDKIKCSAMGKDGNCKICKEKCNWKVHKNMKFFFDTTMVTEKRTVEELRERYQNAERGKVAKALIIKAIEDEINANVGNLLRLINETKQHTERLEEIALRPNPLSTMEYIDLMIEAEKNSKRPNFMERISLLEKLKKGVTLFQGVKDGMGAGQDKANGEKLLQHLQNLIIK